MALQSQLKDRKSNELLQTPEFWHGLAAHGIGVSQTDPVKSIAEQSQVKLRKSAESLQTPEF
jgi:hypothetical protein